MRSLAARNRADAALLGDEWSIGQIVYTIECLKQELVAVGLQVDRLKAQAAPEHRHYFKADYDAARLAVILRTNTARPDGAIARGFEV